jgi:hypothetical protein
MLLADPDSQPIRLLSVACDRTATGHAAAALPNAPRNVRLPIWTIIGDLIE